MQPSCLEIYSNRPASVSNMLGLHASATMLCKSYMSYVSIYLKGLGSFEALGTEGRVSRMLDTC